MKLFIGIEFQPEILDKLYSLQNKLREKVRTARFPARETLHLTLQFLGETPEKAVEAIKQSLKMVANGSRPFALSFEDGLGYFGSADQVRVVWLGMKDDYLVLLELQKNIAQAMFVLGFAQEERDYSPHITLARDAKFNNSQVFVKNGQLDIPVETFPVISVENFSLIESRMVQGRIVYQALERFHLDVQSETSGRYSCATRQ